MATFHPILPPQVGSSDGMKLAEYAYREFSRVSASFTGLTAGTGGGVDTAVTDALDARIVVLETEVASYGDIVTYNASSFATSSHTHDAAVITYSPVALANWTSSTDPGDVDEALDQLASRIKAVETTVGGYGDIVTYSASYFATSGHVHDASVITYAPSTVANWTSSVDPGDVDDALNQLASRTKGIETTLYSYGDIVTYSASSFATSGHVHDASVVTYTPATSANWTSSTDPGDVDDALDQLASRTKSIETTGASYGDIVTYNASYFAVASHTHDASVVTFTPSVNTDWTSSTDPGDTDDALNQLASRTKTLETTNPIEALYIPCSDQTNAITAGTGKFTFRIGYAFTVTAVRASLKTAQTSGSIFTVDINENGTSILSTKLTIDNNEKTSTTAATAAVISDSSLADDSEITIDVDQIGNSTAVGLMVVLIGRRT